MRNPARWTLLTFAVLIIAIGAVASIDWSKALPPAFPAPPVSTRSGTALAQNCTEIKDGMERLACYDRAAKAPNAAASAVKTPALLDDFRIRPGTLEGGSLRVVFKAKVSNNANARLIARTCVRLYDADGFEIAQAFGDEVNLGLGQSDTSTGYFWIEQRLWPQVRSIKAYAAQFGCINSPSQALSQVVETKPSSE
jgi:hypothetical protein